MSLVLALLLPPACALLPVDTCKWLKDTSEPCTAGDCVVVLCDDSLADPRAAHDACEIGDYESATVSLSDLTRAEEKCARRNPNGYWLQQPTDCQETDPEYDFHVGCRESIGGWE